MRSFFLLLAMAGAASAAAGRDCTGAGAFRSCASGRWAGCETVAELRLDDATGTDLGCLASVRLVRGNVTAYGTSLESFRGLEALREVGGYFDAENNAALASLDGLASLRRVGGFLRVFDAPRLASAAGARALVEVGGHLMLGGLAALRELDGPASLERVGGRLLVAYSDRLASLGGLRRLREVGGGLSVEDLGALRRLDGLDALERVGGAFSLTYNGALASVSLPSLGHVGSVGFLAGNPALDCEELFRRLQRVAASPSQSVGCRAS